MEQFERQRGVAANIEEVVVDANRRYLQHALPDGHQHVAPRGCGHSRHFYFVQDVLMLDTPVQKFAYLTNERRPNIVRAPFCKWDRKAAYDHRSLSPAQLWSSSRSRKSLP